MSGLTSVLHLSRDVGVVLGFGCSLGVWLYRREDDLDLACRTTRRPFRLFGAPMLALLRISRLRRVVRRWRTGERGAAVAGRGAQPPLAIGPAAQPPAERRRSP